MLAMGTSKSTNQREQVGDALATFYYLGRLEGRRRDFNLERAIREEGSRPVTQEGMKAEAQRCSADFNARNQAFGSTIQRLTGGQRPAQGAPRPQGAKQPAAPRPQQQGAPRVKQPQKVIRPPGEPPLPSSASPGVAPPVIPLPK